MSEHETPEPEKWLHRIAKAPFVGVKTEDLPQVLEVDTEAASVILADLINAGLVELWEAKRRVCLTPIGAERINAVPVPDKRGRIRWQTRGSNAARGHRDYAKPKKGPDGEKTVLAIDLDAEEQNILDAIPDGPTPEELAEQGTVDLILGLGFVWPGPSVEPAPGQSCKGCRHIRRMPMNAYCAACHRAAKRGLQAPPQPTEPTAVIGLKNAPKPRKDDEDEPEPPRKRRKKLG